MQDTNTRQWPMSWFGHTYHLYGQIQDGKRRYTGVGPWLPESGGQLLTHIEKCVQSDGGDRGCHIKVHTCETVLDLLSKSALTLLSDAV